MPETSRNAPVPLSAPPELAAADRLALFLDVDGTLLDLADHPSAVTVATGLPDNLARIAKRVGGALALLSGRPLAELDRLLGWRDHPAAGLHGAELRTPDGHEHFSGDATAFVDIGARAVVLVAKTHGVILEDKHRALALHFRRAPDARSRADGIARELLREAGTDYALQYGDHVIELKPASADKGYALDALMQSAPFHGRTPWMLGDDLTDEDAFVRVNAMGGVSVIIGARRPTAAQYALPDPAAVRAWLRSLLPH